MEPTARLEQVWARLDLVMDPELDEPVTDMGFIEAVAVDAAGGVDITFRLPTYWCSPNFAFLMAQGIRREVEVLPWVSCARVALQDHMSAEEMNRVVNAGGHFADVFNDVTSDKDLSDLREKFDLKAYQRRQEVVIKALVAQGMGVASVVAMTLAELQSTELEPEADRQKTRYLALLLAKGIASRPTDPALPTYQGTPLTLDTYPTYMNLLRSVRINMEFSGSLCRGLKRNRYKELDPSGDTLTLVDFLPVPELTTLPTQAKHCD